MVDVILIVGVVIFDVVTFMCAPLLCRLLGGCSVGVAANVRFASQYADHEMSPTMAHG